MKHGIAHRKLNRTSEHRAAMFKNMLCSLMDKESLQTTLVKAKDLRPLAEKVITLGKRYQEAATAAERLHLRRQTIQKIGCEKTASKVLTTLADLFKERKGGYVRITKNGFRYGDSAPMAVISFVEFSEASDAKISY
ncbi:50S ribosomal protein L17 [Alphaproteobacteria bacterium]|nr:50S ribosomal protein L17 [Alphaproteobacteria bacterium]GHS95617.1 50S ribosomal protein L17 [Alphaproteobacteria bacterium]